MTVPAIRASQEGYLIPKGGNTNQQVTKLTPDDGAIGWGPGNSTRKTELSITATIVENTNFSTIVSGTGYIHSGDGGYLQISENDFNSSLIIQIEVNGVRIDKTDEVVWVNSQTFNLNFPVDAGDKITIFS